MIVSALTGGIGNQLFQYATGFATASRQGTRFALDIDHFAEHERARRTDATLPDRPFALHRLTISARPLSSFDRLRVNAVQGAGRFAAKVLRRIPSLRVDVIADEEDGDQERLRHLARSTYLTGCWQSENYFADYRDQLVEEFRFKHEPNAANRALIDAMDASNAISVHFRRTDYLHSNTLTRPCAPEYYERAFAAMQAAVPGATYFVFTDEPDWVGRNARLPKGSTLVSHNVGVDDAEDLRLMTRCKHFIVANSSFSWWGAWLGGGPDKRVIAPEIWFEGGHRSESELVPATWSRL